jgi:hypothetical protein
MKMMRLRKTGGSGGSCIRVSLRIIKSWLCKGLGVACDVSGTGEPKVDRFEPCLLAVKA